MVLVGKMLLEAMLAIIIVTNSICVIARPKLDDFLAQLQMGQHKAKALASEPQSRTSNWMVMLRLA